MREVLGWLTRPWWFVPWWVVVMVLTVAAPSVGGGLKVALAVAWAAVLLAGSREMLRLPDDH